uniref:Transposase n=1 Tax=Streptomyces sp. NBC_00093 TaxID=2975649 RepID=A0AAU2AGD6_9ACTN
MRYARNGALLTMVGSVHWKLLVDLLGISNTAAQRWHVAAGADRAGYVASRLKQDAAAGPE